MTCRQAKAGCSSRSGTGFRCLAFRDGDTVDLRSRNDRPLSRYFSELVAGFLALAEPRIVLDGEVLVLVDGQADFNALMARLHPAASRAERLAAATPARFVAFDLLALGEDDLRPAGFAERRAALEAALRHVPRPLHLTVASDDRRTATRWLEQAAGGGLDGVMAKPGLLWAANLSTVELHPYLARAERLEQPDFVVFDLDPGEPADVLDACRVALLLRGLLDGLGLPSPAKTSGASGVHVYAGVADHTYAATKSFARAVARRLSAQHPQLVVDRMTRSLRAGRVLVDWSQNDAGKSTIAPYSLRGLDVPTVSTPLSWDELEAAAVADDWRALVFGPGEVLDRLDRAGDLFAPVLEPPRHADLPRA